MNKPQYELIPLRAAVLQCRTNIIAFQQGIAKEENKIDELQGYIKEWEEYNDNSGKPDSQS